jgi:hypothetical protein
VCGVREDDRSRTAALLQVIAHSLERQLRTDPRLEAACAGLQRLGFGVMLRLEVTSGASRPGVSLAVVQEEMPQWTEEDKEVLRSVGIAIGPTGSTGEALKPRRRQPR